jgi:hypothetical protein
MQMLAITNRCWHLRGHSDTYSSCPIKKRPDLNTTPGQQSYPLRWAQIVAKVTT